MKIKTSELTRSALNWAVAMAAGYTDVKITAYEDPDNPDECFFRPGKVVDGIEICGSGLRWEPSTDWAQGGPIIVREKLTVEWVEFYQRWEAHQCGNFFMHGELPLVVAMRCYIASKQGDEVEIPEELTQFKSHEEGKS